MWYRSFSKGIRVREVIERAGKVIPPARSSPFCINTSAFFNTHSADRRKTYYLFREPAEIDFLKRFPFLLPPAKQVIRFCRNFFHKPRCPLIRRKTQHCSPLYNLLKIYIYELHLSFPSFNDSLNELMSFPFHNPYNFLSIFLIPRPTVLHHLIWFPMR